MTVTMNGEAKDLNFGVDCSKARTKLQTALHSNLLLTPTSTIYGGSRLL
jgi:hypothetical protein